jgi:FAD/FMN-containing dehydrogenase
MTYWSIIQRRIDFLVKFISDTPTLVVRHRGPSGLTVPPFAIATSSRGDAVSASAAFGGRLIFPDDAGYDSARQVWNKAIDRRPAMIAQCRGTEDVVAALGIAREHGLRVAVRGGGHSFPGHSTCDGGMVIDLGGMKELVVDARHRTLTAGPGLTWAEVADATAPYGLAAAGGHVSSVGIAGLTLGGGNGWLAPARTG